MKILVAVIAAIIVFEVIEHVVVPLIWTVITRRKRSASGATGLLGEVAVVKRWKEAQGYVFVKGELWQAVSNDPLSVGDRVAVESVKGLTLKVKPLVKA